MPPSELVSKAIKERFLLKVHCSPKVKVQPALLFPLLYNSSINELENMKLSEHIGYEMIN